MECPGFRNCTERRVEEAAQRARIDQKLINIEAIVVEMKQDFKDFKQSAENRIDRTDRRINKLYAKVAGITGGIIVVGYVLEHLIK